MLDICTAVKVQLRKEEEHFKTRFSVHRIRDLLPNLEDHQKQWINEAGFGALLTLAEFSLPVKLVKWMLKHVDPLLREFRYRNKVIVFNRDLVCKILGLQNGIIPLRLSGDSEDVKKLREVYKDGDRAKIAKCKEIVQSSKDRDSFVRAFSLLALGTIYTPGTGNYVSLKYLHSLIDISEISTFNWVGHVLDELMNEVKKYHKFTPDRLDKDHQMGSCLIILAIAYMDHLDLPTDRGGHQLNYNLPRICNVSNIDFDFILAVDKNRLALGNTFGKLPFRDFYRTPYGAATIVQEHPAPAVEIPAPAATEEVPDLAATEEIPAVSSLDEWLHHLPSSNNLPHQIPLEYQNIASHYSKLVEQDVLQLADAISTTISAQIKDKVMAMWRRRHIEMLGKMADLANMARNDGVEAGVSTFNVDAAAPSMC
uniref:Aminotransferase-like plant mobile domain-containing protein n=1 Tax=Setaria italica TaxID=4555 RepID=K3ZNX9_SETIT